MSRKIGYARTIEKQKALVKVSAKVQLIVLFVLSIVVCLVTGAKTTMILSTIVGGVCGLVPNLFFAFYAFKYKGAKEAKKVLTSFYLAEILKFVLVITMLTASYAYSNRQGWLEPVGILIGFTVVFLSILLIPVFTRKN